jgi:hypothetical protein
MCTRHAIHGYLAHVYFPTPTMHLDMYNDTI